MRKSDVDPILGVIRTYPSPPKFAPIISGKYYFSSLNVGHIPAKAPPSTSVSNCYSHAPCSFYNIELHVNNPINVS
jgi:hypothetical protein